jgi:hypothetical protein
MVNALLWAWLVVFTSEVLTCCCHALVKQRRRGCAGAFGTEVDTTAHSEAKWQP